jgi:hypothetical protein
VSPRIGYFLSCEEYAPHELVEQAVAAEQAGFEGLWISDHFHPWNDEQGQSPFVWSVIGGRLRCRHRPGFARARPARPRRSTFTVTCGPRPRTGAVTRPRRSWPG